MELGGNDPFIVLADADSTVLKDVLSDARTYNCGQVCTSSKRIIVVESRYDEVMNILHHTFAGLKPGNPLDENTSLAPMNSQRAADKLAEQGSGIIQILSSLLWRYSRQYYFVPIDKKNASSKVNYMSFFCINRIPCLIIYPIVHNRHYTTIKFSTTTKNRKEIV